METKLIETEKTDRLLSLDALRGFDMFWITGGATLFIHIGKLTGADWLVEQMDHVKWEGFHLLDLVFPLFMFLSGVSIPFAINSKLEKGAAKKLMVAKAFKRMMILVVIGIIFNESLRGDLKNIRYASVLAQIGIAYFIAAIISIYFTSLKSRLWWIAGIMATIAFIQLLIPAPGFSAGELTMEGSINGYIDRLLTPGRLYVGKSDPEGVMNIISAAAITLMGAVAGYFLREKNRNEWQKVKLLFIIGAVLVVLALVIHPFYPMIKNCWTTTFNLMAGGISFMLMALFYMLIDVMKWQRWSFYFRIIGMNSIFIYLFSHFFDISRPVSYLFGWVAVYYEAYNPLITTMLYMIFFWVFLYFMYKRKIFLKV